MGNNPYPIRYQAEISQLMCGIRDNVNGTQSLVYSPYGSLTPNSEGHSYGYPISFIDARTKDGCICYSVSSGDCNGGLRCNC